MHERAAVTAGLTAMMVESGGVVTRVVAEIGPGVDPAVVTGIWDEVVSGTSAQSAELTLNQALDTLRCISCGADYSGSKLDPCPECEGNGLVIERAPEFVVSSWIGAG